MLRWLHVVDGKLALPGEPLRLLPCQPLVVLLERDVWLVRICDPHRPVDHVVHHLRLCLSEDDPITTNLDWLLGLVVSGRGNADATEPAHYGSLLVVAANPMVGRRRLCHHPLESSPREGLTLHS